MLDPLLNYTIIQIIPFLKFISREWYVKFQNNIVKYQNIQKKNHITEKNVEL